MTDKYPTTVKTEPTLSYAIQVDAGRTTDATIKTGAWENDLFGCFTHVVPNCLMTFFCPCVSIAQISKRLGIASYLLACFGSCLLMYVGFACCVVWYIRATTREKFQLPGSAFGDCCASCCCACCVISQVATHVKSYKPGDCSFAEPDTLPAFQ